MHASISAFHYIFKEVNGVLNIVDRGTKKVRNVRSD